MSTIKKGEIKQKKSHVLYILRKYLMLVMLVKKIYIYMLFSKSIYSVTLNVSCGVTK